MKRFLLVLALGVALLLPAVPASAGVPGTTQYTNWGWVTIRNITSGTHTPAKADRGNSSGQKVTYVATGDGGFAVLFKGLANPGGTAHATALDAAGHFCQVHAWFPDGNGLDEWVEVDCFTVVGVHNETKLTVSFLATNMDRRLLGYMFSGDPTSSHAAAPATSYNSSHGANQLDRVGVGQYEVIMPGIGTYHGNVLVTAVYDDLTSPGAPNVKGSCAVMSALPDGPDHVIEIACFDLAGSAADIPFVVSYAVGEGLQGHGAAHAAYLFADTRNASSYVPVKAYRYSSAGTKPRITRTAAGTYAVSLPGMPAHGSVQISAFEPGMRCNATSIRTSTPQTIGVRCRNIATAQPHDAGFTLSYEK